MLRRASASVDLAAAVEIALAPERTMHRLTSWLPEYRTGTTRVVLGEQALPMQVGATLDGPMRVLCCGPGDWLIVFGDGAVPGRDESKLRSEGLVRVDISDGLAVLAVSGPASRELLSKGCGLDLHPGSFPDGRCARTRFAQMPVVLDCLDTESRFGLYVRRSYRQYLHEWLLDAAMEF